MADADPVINVESAESLCLHPNRQWLCPADGRVGLQILHAYCSQVLVNTAGHLHQRLLAAWTQANAALQEAVPRMAAWLGTYTGCQPTPAALVTSGWQGREAADQALCISQVGDIEEAIWAPRHGLKGMVDASVRALLQPASHCPVRLLPACAWH